MSVVDEPSGQGMTPSTLELIRLLETVKRMPRHCVAPFGDLLTEASTRTVFAQLAQLVKKGDYTPTSFCRSKPEVGARSDTLDEQNAEARWRCTLRYDEVAIQADGSGRESAYVFRFDVNGKLRVVEKSLRCDFAG